jgi:hypothetical protein
VAAAAACERLSWLLVRTVTSKRNELRGFIDGTVAVEDAAASTCNDLPAAAAAGGTGTTLWP